MAVLELNNISKHFGAIQAVNDISISLEAGEVVGLMGDNGAGKSTLVKMIAGNFPPSHGTMRMDGKELVLHKPVEARRHGIEIVHQDLALCNNLTAAANVFLGRELHTMRDITERKRAEAALRESERIHSLIFNSVSECIWLVEVRDGESYYFRSVNDAFENVTGLTRHQVLDRPMEEWFPQDSLELVKGKYREVVTTGKPIRYEEITLLPAGLRVGEISIIPILDSTGTCIQLLGTAHDVTERKKSEEALRSSEERYRLLAGNTDDFVTLVDRRGNRLYVSPSYYRATGWTADDLNTTDWRTRVHPDDLALGERTHAANLAGQQTTIEHRVRCRDGSWIWVELNCKPLVDSDGRVQSFLNCSRVITQRKQAEEALRQSEERYRLLADNTDDFVALIDQHGKLSYMSPSFFRATGWTRADLDTTDWRTRVHPEDLSDVEKANIAALAGEQSSVEYRVVCRDGSWLWVERNSKPLFGPGGEVEKTLLWSRDITRRKQLEEILRASEERHRGVVEDQTEIISRFSGDGRILFANETFCRFFGKTAENVIGNSWQPRVVPEDLPHIEAKLRTLSPAHPVVMIENRVFAGDDQVHWMQFVNRGFFDAQGYLLEVQSVGRDITERKRADAALVERESRLRAINHASPLGVFVTDPGGMCSYTNPAYQALSGLTFEQALGRGWERMIHPEDHPRAIADWYAAVARKPFHYENVHRYIHVSGRIIWVRVQSAAMTDGETVLGYVGTVEDITERRRLEREIIEISDRERNRIGQDLHDSLCQQLIGVAFAANQLTRQMKGRSAAQRAVAEDIAESLDDAITHARQIARGLYPVSLHAGGLPSALQELAAQVTQRSKIACDIDVDETLAIRDSTAATHLFRIAQEAVNNAVKHAQANRIVIRLQRAKDRLELSISDDGVGLPAADHRTEGMGLQILNYRAGAVGAKLALDSAPGSGTVVTCAVPLELIV